MLGPFIAGLVLGAAERSTGNPITGTVVGMQMLVSVALGLALISLAIQIRWMPHREAPPPGPRAMEILRSMPIPLRRLLLAEIFARWCDWLVRDFIVLYLLLEFWLPKETAGGLISIQHVTALVIYLPIAGMTTKMGLTPFIGLTFVFFALFPLTLAIMPKEFLFLAFIVYGLREIGEPARKATITNLFPEPVRARGVGLYWGIRSFAMCWSSLAGAAIWYFHGPKVLLISAFVLGLLGAAIFYLLVGKLDRQTELPLAENLNH
jgi:hypothetical protein